MKTICRKKKAVSVLTALCLVFGAGAILVGNVGKAEEKTYTESLQSGFGGQMRLGTWKQTETNAPELIDELCGAPTGEGQYPVQAYLDADFGGLTDEEAFTIRYNTVVPTAGQVAFNFRAAKNVDFNPYQSFGGVLVRLDPTVAYVLNNGAVVLNAAGYSSTVTGSEVSVTVTVRAAAMDLLIEREEEVILRQENIAVCSNTENKDKNGASSIRAGFYLESSEGSFSDIEVTSGENSYKAFPFEAAPPRKTYTESLQSGFGGQMRLGTWKQTEANAPELIDELCGAPTGEGQYPVQAYLDADFGGLTDEEAFTIRYNTVVPTAGQVAFNFRAAKNIDFNPYQSFGGVLVRLDPTVAYVLNNGAVVLNAAGYSSTVTGSEVSVTVTVRAAAMDLLIEREEEVILRQENIAVCSNTENKDKNGASSIRAGFYLESSEGSFSDIEVTSGENSYKAFPFEAAPVTLPDDKDPNTEFAQGTATYKLNPNFTLMCGDVLQGENDSFMQGTTLHVQKETASVISNFGGVYGENFKVEFDVATPSENEAAANEDASSGFFFRASDPTDCYSGNGIRVQSTLAFFIIPSTEGGNASLKGFVFDEKPAAGALVRVILEVVGNSATVSFLDVNNRTMMFKINGVGDSVSSCTFGGLKPYDAEADEYAGLFTSKSLGKIKNLVMSDESGKTFAAWPFAEGKQDLSDQYVIRTTNVEDRVVEADTANPDFDKNDYDIIAEGFTYIIYTEYNGEVHDLQILRTDGSPVESDYIVTINYKRPPYTTIAPYLGEADANRHGIYVTLSDSDGYVYANFKCALRILPKVLAIEGVTAVDRSYDGSRVVELTGGRLVGVPEGKDIGFELGTGQLTSAAAGTGKEVEVYIALTGADAKNFSLIQPVVTVNINKASQAAPETPEAEVFGNVVTIKATGEDDYLEFRLDDGEWQETGRFENVADGTHTVYVRYKEEKNYVAGEAAQVNVTVGNPSGANDGSLSDEGSSRAPRRSGCGSVLTMQCVWIFFGLSGIVFMIGRKKRSE